jgi:uncharacterized membrane protein (DUF4010 family)
VHEELRVFYQLGVALAIGLLIGVERGWQERAAAEGQRIAGVRTYGLIGLLGGGMAMLGERLGGLLPALAFLALAGVLTSVHVASLRMHKDVGITSLIAALVTFVLGALAALGEVATAAAAGVVTVLLLGSKPLLHRWVGALEWEELGAAVKLLLISVVLLPILPDEGYGPWGALNPYRIWWMVVLVAAISFVGYFAMKIGGPRRGVAFTGFFGGLAASTAVTLHFSRIARRQPSLRPLMAMGILLACGTMFPRMLLLASVVHPDLFRPLLAPTLVMALASFVPAFWSWRKQPRVPEDLASPLRNPLELGTAVGFGLLLAIVLLLGTALTEWFGTAGVLALAAASGVADVDAITLSLARLSEGWMAVAVAVAGIVIAAAVNSLVKAGVALAIGGRELGLRVVPALAVCAVAGLMVAWLALGAGA